MEHKKKGMRQHEEEIALVLESIFPCALIPLILSYVDWVYKIERTISPGTPGFLFKLCIKDGALVCCKDSHQSRLLFYNLKTGLEHRFGQKRLRVSPYIRQANFVRYSWRGTGPIDCIAIADQGVAIYDLEEGEMVGILGKMGLAEGEYMDAGDVIQMKSGHIAIADEHASKILVYNSFGIVEYMFQVPKGGEVGNYIMHLATMEDILFIWYDSVSHVALWKLGDEVPFLLWSTNLGLPHWVRNVACLDSPNRLIIVVSLHIKQLSVKMFTLEGKCIRTIFAELTAITSKDLSLNGCTVMNGERLAVFLNDQILILHLCP